MRGFVKCFMMIPFDSSYTLCQNPYTSKTAREHWASDLAYPIFSFAFETAVAREVPQRIALWYVCWSFKVYSGHDQSVQVHNSWISIKCGVHISAEHFFDGSFILFTAIPTTDGNSKCRYIVNSLVIFRLQYTCFLFLYKQAVISLNLRSLHWGRRVCENPFYLAENWGSLCLTLSIV